MMHNSPKFLGSTGFFGVSAETDFLQTNFAEWTDDDDDDEENF